jgi:hypothetical protein
MQNRKFQPGAKDTKKGGNSLLEIAKNNFGKIEKTGELPAIDPKIKAKKAEENFQGRFP